MDPVMKIFSPYDVVTCSVKVIGSDVASVQLLVELDTWLVVVVRIVVPEGTLEEVPQSTFPVTQEPGTSTRGRPDAIGTGILPFESTWTDEQVYNSTS
jgi:hypothetical protein